MPVSDKHFRSRRARDGFTLVEVVVSIAIVAMVISGVICGYIQSAKRAEWSGYSFAAQALSIQQIEQVRAAVWDPPCFGDSGKNEFTNVFGPSLLSWTPAGWGGTGYTTNTLDLPVSSSQWILATNFITLTYYTVSNTANNVNVYMLKVATVWPFVTGTKTNYYTNSIASYFAPDNPQ